jgi:hypothetical protein
MRSGNGVGVIFMDLLEELDVGDSLLIVGDDVFVQHLRGCCDSRSSS